MNPNATENPQEKTSKPICRYITIILRTLLGLLFVMTGLMYFLHMMPQPKPGEMPAGAEAFSGALMTTGYMMPLIMGTQLLAGLLLVSNSFVPLALTIIAPIIVGIITFHAFLAPSGLVMAIVVLIIELYLAWAYRNAFRPMLAFRARHGC